MGALYRYARVRPADEETKEQERKALHALARAQYRLGKDSTDREAAREKERCRLRLAFLKASQEIVMPQALAMRVAAVMETAGMGAWVAHLPVPHPGPYLPAGMAGPVHAGITFLIDVAAGRIPAIPAEVRAQAAQWQHLRNVCGAQGLDTARGISLHKIAGGDGGWLCAAGECRTASEAARAAGNPVLLPILREHCVDVQFWQRLMVFLSSAAEGGGFVTIRTA